MKHRIIRTQKQRIAWSNTSRISDERVVEAIKFVAQHVDMDRVVVHFKRFGNRSSYGRCYPSIPEIANLDGLKKYWEWRYLITVTDHQGWVETLAHEAKHVEQFRERKPISEVACRAFQAWVGDLYERRTAP